MKYRYPARELHLRSWRGGRPQTLRILRIQALGDSVEAGHFTGNLGQSLCIDRFLPRSRRLLARGEQRVAVGGIKPQPLEFDVKNLAGALPPPQIGQQPFDLLMHFSRLTDGQASDAGKSLIGPLPPLSIQLFVATVFCIRSIRA